MKTNIIFLQLLGLIVLAACFSACETPCDDPQDMECPNFDPCFGEVWVEPEIVIKEMLFSRADTFYHTVTDTVLQTANLVSFSTNVEYESYSWIIGSDPREFNENEVRLTFLSNSGSIPITLIGERKAAPCFPGKSLVDTLTATLTVLPFLQSSILGSYFGHIEGSPEDTFTVKIWIDSVSVASAFFYSISAPMLCDKVEWYDGATSLGERSMGYEALYSRIGGCPAFEAVCRLAPDDNNVIVMQYRLTPSGDPRDTPDPSQNFIGTRIP